MRSKKFKENYEWQNQSILILRWMGEAKMQHPEFPPDNHITKGGQWKKYDLVKFIFAHYEDLSPKNQVRYLGGHKPYQGKINVDLKMKSGLNRCYGRLGNNFMDFFQLTFFKEICNE